MAENKSGIRPVEYKVLIRPDEEKGFVELKGGHKLWKPDETKERDQHAAMEGVLVEASPLAFSYDEWPEDSPRPQAGDRVIFARYAGINTRGADGRDYRLMNDKDIVAVRS
jgi:co-chaperonin GroES (HSP10)